MVLPFKKQLLIFGRDEDLHSAIDPVESDVIAVMDFHTGIAASGKIGDTGTSGVKNGGTAF